MSLITILSIAEEQMNKIVMMNKNSCSVMNSINVKNHSRDIVKVNLSDSYQGRILQILYSKALPDTFFALGNYKIFKNRKLAFFCSMKCPGEIITTTYNLMKNLRNQGITVISGFHSPIEQECLNILLRGKQPIIMCPAKNIKNIRLKPELKREIDNGRLLIISPFTAQKNRISTRNSIERNYFVAAIADTIFISHAEPLGKVERLCSFILKHNKSAYTFDSKYNTNLTKLGAKPLNEYDIIIKECFESASL